MPLRDTKKLSVTNLLIGHTAGDFNPLAADPSQGELDNFTLRPGKLVRVPFAPLFQNPTTASEVWRIVDFPFARDGAVEQQLLIFKADGKVYRRLGGDEVEIFPCNTGLALLAEKPVVEVLANRVHVSEGSQYLIYDGWDWFEPITDVTDLAALSTVAGSLTGDYILCVTRVHIRNGVRIHESNRSNLRTAAAASQNYRVTFPTADSRQTHWSVYMSEVSESLVFRRVATISTTESTTDISAEPATNAPIAPIRNDPQKPTRVLAQWKNRLVGRNEENPSEVWFTSFEEVLAGTNGAPEESFSGRRAEADITSDTLGAPFNATLTNASDILNQFILPQKGEELRAAIWHDDFLFLFSNKKGYVVTGEGGLLDNNQLRDFFPRKQFDFGAAGPDCVASFPGGLAVLSPEKHLWLWRGGADVLDLGVDIQDDLDEVTSASIAQAELVHWDGNKRDWLILKAGFSSNHIKAIDFALRPQGRIGAWQKFSHVAASTIGIYKPGNQPFLLVGETDGDVRQLDTLCDPAHLNLSATLGSTYLSASVQNSPAATVRSPSLSLQPDRWIEAKYMSIAHRTDQDTEATGNRSTAPTVTAFYDQLDPETPSSGAVLTLGSALPDDSQRAWFRPATASSAAGAFAKRLQIQLAFAAGADTLTTGSNDTLLNNEILKLAVVSQPKAELTQ